MNQYILSILVCTTLNLSAQKTIETKFSLPDGYERVIINEFHKWVISQPLKMNNKVFYTNGDEKMNNNIWAAVFDYELGSHKYHQCADAAIYLNAVFKYENGYKNRLNYSFTNGDKTSYIDWLNGANYKLNPNDQNDLIKTFNSSREDNLNTFYDWLKTLWTWAGTGSLPYDTIEIEIFDMEPGDIFNQSGHAISVIDVIINKDNGKKKFMISQSFMVDPTMGDEQHVLLNPKSGNVWYDLIDDTVFTPEWIMNPKIIRFKE